MVEKAIEVKKQDIIDRAAAQMTQFNRNLALYQLRLRCCEIILMTGSQTQKVNIEVEAEKLYNFAVGKKESAK